MKKIIMLFLGLCLPLLSRGGIPIVEFTLVNTGSADFPGSSAYMTCTVHNYWYDGSYHTNFTIMYLTLPAIAAGHSALIDATDDLPGATWPDCDYVEFDGTSCFPVNPT